MELICGLLSHLLSLLLNKLVLLLATEEGYTGYLALKVLFFVLALKLQHSLLPDPLMNLSSLPRPRKPCRNLSHLLTSSGVIRHAVCVPAGISPLCIPEWILRGPATPLFPITSHMISTFLWSRFGVFKAFPCSCTCFTLLSLKTRWHVWHAEAIWFSGLLLNANSALHCQSRGLEQHRVLA